MKFKSCILKFKKEKQELQSTISKIVWRVGFNLTEEQIKSTSFKPFYTFIPIPELTIESIECNDKKIPNVGEYFSFKYPLGIDNHRFEDFLFVKFKIKCVEKVLDGESSSFYIDIFGDVVSIHDRNYAKLLNLEENI